MSKQRIDQLLVEKNLVESRSKAQALIMSGNVLVNGEKITKAGTRFADDVEITIKEKFPYVSRGALKLEKALESFPISVENRIALDIGSSTGGFTDLLLQRGATKVYAVDVGTNQLAYSLRRDERVVVMEQTNARYLQPEQFNPLPTLAVTDVSFISLKLILPVIYSLECSEAVALIKPQFEIGKEIPGFTGVVKKDEDRQKAIERVKAYAKEIGFKVAGLAESPITGPKGNVEYLLYLKRA